MRENEFEKQVRKKMDELGFDPSETVWDGIDKEINREKKRRRPFFWLLFCSGLLLAGSGYYFFTTKNNRTPLLKTEPQVVKNNPKQEERSVHPDNEVVHGTIGNEINPANKKDPYEITQTKNAWRKQSLTGKTVGEKSYKNRNKYIEKTESEKENQRDPDGKNDDISIDNYNKTPANIVSAKQTEQIIDSAAAEKKNPLAENKITKTDSLTKNSTAAASNDKNQKSKKSKWEIGYTAGAGVSNINQSLFAPLYASANYLTYPSGVPAGGSVNPSTPAKPDFSFVAGAFVTRSISKRISFSVGLNYHYYSTRIMTGSKINGNPPVSLSTNRQLNVNSYYQNGNEHSYTNKYHFLEIPVTAAFQLTKSKKMPVSWELGFSLAYLLNSNALYYDPAANVYFAPDRETNKMQVNAVTAILFGFHANKNEWQIGPQFQYGLTGLYTAQSDNPGHLMYGGIKITFIPGKK